MFILWENCVYFVKNTIIFVFDCNQFRPAGIPSVSPCTADMQDKTSLPLPRIPLNDSYIVDVQVHVPPHNPEVHPEDNITDN